MSVPVQAKMSCPQGPRQVVPMAGFGPHGFPECYYTSRELNSTGRYVKFVNKLRAEEERLRLGKINLASKLYDTNRFKFYTRTQRKCLMVKAGNLFDRCMESYENDLQEKRKKMIALYEAENKRDISLFATMAQKGGSVSFEDKMKRLAYLYDKRKKEDDAKYSKSFEEKCPYVRPHVFKLREIEATKMNQYLIEDNQKRKMAEAELDNMWYEVVLKESEALAARIEVDSIEQYRRETDGQRQLAEQLELRRQQRERDRERLMQEVREMKAQIEANERMENEKKQRIRDENIAAVQKYKETLAEAKIIAAQKAADNKLVTEAWNSVIPITFEKMEIERKRQMQREMIICNNKMSELRKQYTNWKLSADPLILEEGRRRQDAAELKLNQDLEEIKRQRMLNEKNIMQQIKEKEADVGDRYKKKEREEYQRQVSAQVDQFMKFNRMMAEQAKKKYMKELDGQVEYNNILKERAKQEELDQVRKYKIANDEYQKTLDDIIRRPHLSEHVHLFKKILDKHLPPVTTKN